LRPAWKRGVRVAARKNGVRLAARESRKGDWCVGGTPLFMASPHCGVNDRDRRGWLPRSV
jgi:hypothetical protein